MCERLTNLLFRVFVFYITECIKNLSYDTREIPDAYQAPILSGFSSICQIGFKAYFDKVTRHKKMRFIWDFLFIYLNWSFWQKFLKGRNYHSYILYYWNQKSQKVWYSNNYRLFRLIFIHCQTGGISNQTFYLIPRVWHYHFAKGCNYLLSQGIIIFFLFPVGRTIAFVSKFKDITLYDVRPDAITVKSLRQ